ncbi:MAG: hypothetical protein GKR90_18530 [Pseudomonadales bacterium]|nr:hypothetical protein [Pseudomonadales bacterium]
MSEWVASFFRMLLATVARFSRSQSVGVSRFLVKFAGRSDSLKVTEINLRTCFPELNDDEINQLAKASLEQMFLMFFELGQLKYWSKEELLGSVEIIGAEVLDDAVAADAGILLLVPHIGNWELMCAYLGERHELNALYDPPKVAGLESVILEARERFSGKMHPIGIGGLRAVIRVLRSGGLLAVLPDQVPERGSGVYAEFFGQTALTMNLVDQLVTKTAPRVLLGWVQRVAIADGDWRQGYNYRLSFSALPLSHLADLPTESERQVATARAVNAAIEDVVKIAPEQYQWEYKRFKRPPELGKTNIYRRQ